MRAALPFSAAVRCAHIHIRDVDDAGFLLMLCVHSPGATRVLLANKIIVPFLRPMTMETRCSKVIFPNYSKKEPAEDTLVPPLWGTRGFFFFFVGLFVHAAVRGGTCAFTLKIVNTLNQ